MVRQAASMLELVVAIVIMGIAMMTLPLMLTRIQNNNNFAIQQEAILIARTQIGDILTYRWDEKSMDSNFNFGVLDTNSTYFKRNNSSRRRVGHIKGNKRRKYFSTERNASIILGKEGTNYNDIDDFNNVNNINLSGTNSDASLGYKLNDSNMSILVEYIDDNNASPFSFYPSTLPVGITTTNIKMITVSLSQLDNNLSLRAFSCNLGANRLLRKNF